MLKKLLTLLFLFPLMVAAKERIVIRNQAPWTPQKYKHYPLNNTGIYFEKQNVVPVQKYKVIPTQRKIQRFQKGKNDYYQLYRLPDKTSKKRKARKDISK